MKLYYSPGACALAPHITLCATDLAYELVKVDLQQKTTETGEDYHSINPFGYVPSLALDDGTILFECPAILQYLADQAPEKNLAPEPDSFDRYLIQQWLNFIATELHKGLGMLFNPAFSQETREILKSLVSRRLDILAPQLERHDFLMGNQFTIADSYLFTVLSWCPHVDFDLSGWPDILAYQKRIYPLPAVQKALTEEGLISL